MEYDPRQLLRWLHTAAARPARFGPRQVYVFGGECDSGGLNDVQIREEGAGPSPVLALCAMCNLPGSPTRALPPHKPPDPTLTLDFRQGKGGPRFEPWVRPRPVSGTQRASATVHGCWCLAGATKGATSGSPRSGFSTPVSPTPTPTHSAAHFGRDMALCGPTGPASPDWPLAPNGRVVRVECSCGGGGTSTPVWRHSSACAATPR